MAAIGAPQGVEIGFKSISGPLAQLVKASVSQADVQRFEPRLGHNLLCVSCKVQELWAPSGTNHNGQFGDLLAGGSVAIQTWSIYRVYT